MGLTVLDDTTGLEWEKKTTTFGSGVNAADLHDVDNIYAWAGQCTLNASVYCQPNAAAATTCAAQTDGAFGCAACGGGDGTCNVDPFSVGAITTVWDWLNQLNTASYAGHTDWRLPSESACNTCGFSFTSSRSKCIACDAHELETILLSPYPCGTSPCIASIFGPTGPYTYWSSATYTTDPQFAWTVLFNTGYVFPVDKAFDHYVRAVRGGS